MGLKALLLFVNPSTCGLKVLGSELQVFWFFVLVSAGSSGIGTKWHIDAQNATKNNSLWDMKVEKNSVYKKATVF